MLGAAAGTLFGLVAGLLKLVTVQAQSGLGHALAHWSLWVLIVVGAGAVLLNQRAYQNARLSITAPMLNIAQVLVAITFGIIVFGERFDGSTLAFVAEDRRAGADGDRNLATGRAADQRFADRRATERS